MPLINRRTFLGTAAVAGSFLPTGKISLGAEQEQSASPLILRQANPENLEMPFADLNSFITPISHFYVRSHFPVPQLDVRSWKLQILGSVHQPCEFTLEQLVGLPSKTMTVTLECAGNGRAFLEPKVKGVQWQLGAVGNAEWTGVPLATVLEKAGIPPSTIDVILEGSDEGEPTNDPKPVGRLPFVHSVPLAKVQSGDVLLAYKMNGKELSAAHGYPLRAIVAGWYGMASVKWLRRISLVERPFHGYDQTIDYAVWDRRTGYPSLTPITAMEVKSSIARPVAGEKLRAGKSYRIHGAAWAGEQQIRKVEISIDGGTSWNLVKLEGERVPFAWRLWEFEWSSPAPGRHTIMVRAEDDAGRCQPLRRDPDRRSYVINHIVPIEVMVE